MLNQPVFALVDKTISSLKSDDTVERARQMLSQSTFPVLPVTENGRFLNFIKAADLVKMKKKTLLKNFVQYDENVPKLFETTYVNQVVAVFLSKNISHLNILPVINCELHYIGCNEKTGLFESVLRELKFEYQVCSVKVLIPTKAIYPLSTFFSFLEKKNIHILTAFIHQEIDQTHFTLTLTSENTSFEDLKILITQLGYKIIEPTSSLREGIMNEGLKNKIDSFLRMMDV